MKMSYSLWGLTNTTVAAWALRHTLRSSNPTYLVLGPTLMAPREELWPKLR